MSKVRAYGGPRRGDGSIAREKGQSNEEHFLCGRPKEQSQRSPTDRLYHKTYEAAIEAAYGANYGVTKCMRQPMGQAMGRGDLGSGATYGTPFGANYGAQTTYGAG